MLLPPQVTLWQWKMLYSDADVNLEAWNCCAYLDHHQNTMEDPLHGSREEKTHGFSKSVGFT